MFTILEIVPFHRERSFLKRLFYKTPEPQIERIALRGGGFFYSVMAYKDKNNMFAEKEICDAIGNAASRVILKNSTTLPLDSKMHLFQPELFPTLLFSNMVLEYLKETKNEKEDRTLGILDPKGCLSQNVLAYVPYAKSICICTKHPERYQMAEKEALEEYGLPLTITENVEKCRDASVFLEPLYLKNPELFGYLHERKGFETIYCGENLNLPPEFEERCPTNVDKIFFAAALYEISNIKNLENLSYANRKRIKTL